MGQIRLLEISGTPYEMGYQHGQAYADDIRRFTEERVRLSSDPNWTGRHLTRGQVMSLGQACLDAHDEYAPELVEELRGMADATGLGLADLVIMNGFTDFIDAVYNAQMVDSPQMPHAIDDCTAFLVPGGATADGHGLFGQTWDMHATATPYVIMLSGRPKGKPAFMAFTTIGVLGLIGINDAGIAVGMNNLMTTDGQPGVTYTFVVRKVLEQTNIDDALECIVSARLSGAHNYLIMDKTGRGYNIEAMPTRCHIDTLNAHSIVHTNHCVAPQTLAVARERPVESQRASEARYMRATDLLEERSITPELLMALTRDEEAICVLPKPPLHVETCGAAIMRPATGDLWAVWGLPTHNEYEHFVL